MKIIFLISILSISIGVMAQDKKTKEFRLESKVQSVMLHEKDRYKVQFTSLASFYYADKKHFSCLSNALKNKKAVDIKATAIKHEITSCKEVKK